MKPLMKILHLILLITCFGISPTLVAAEDPYIQFEYTYINTDIGANTVHPTVLNAIFGYEVFRNFGLELTFGAGLRADEINVKTLFGGYLKAYLPISEHILVVGRAGFNSISYDYKTSQTDSGPSYGVGLALKTSTNSQISLEYRKLADILDTNTALNAIVLGWQIK